MTPTDWNVAYAVTWVRSPSGREAMLHLTTTDAFRVWLKEVAVGAINGIVLGLLIGVVGWLWKGNAWLGAVVGLGGALALSRLMSGLLFGISGSDPLTITAVAILFGGVALVASYVPARRASRLDPVEALRIE